MTQTPHVRHATHDDLGPLLDLYQHLIPGDDRPEPDLAARIFDRFLSYPGSGIIIATAGAEPLAACTLVVIPNLTRGGTPYGLIENVVTHAAHRNRGLGKQVLAAATAAAWQAGCYKVMLMTGSARPETLAFYRGAGFEQTKTGFQIRRRPARDDAARNAG
jgi:GNAT superfamily N-acetyltransferase